MRPFSELAPGDLFFWQAKTWQKLEPTANPIPHKPPVNAIRLTDPPVLATLPGWPVVVEPSDVEELSQTLHNPPPNP